MDVAGARAGKERTSLVDKTLQDQCEEALTETGKYAVVFSIEEGSHGGQVDGAPIGVAVRCGQHSSKPVWVSVGHRISLASAAEIASSIVRQVHMMAAGHFPKLRYARLSGSSRLMTAGPSRVQGV